VAVGEDVDSMLARFHDVKAPLGVPPAKFSVGEGGLEDCVTVWETITLLASFVQDPSTLY